MVFWLLCARGGARRGRAGATAQVPAPISLCSNRSIMYVLNFKCVCTQSASLLSLCHHIQIVSVAGDSIGIVQVFKYLVTVLEINKIWLQTQITSPKKKGQQRLSYSEKCPPLVLAIKPSQ